MLRLPTRPCLKVKKAKPWRNTNQRAYGIFAKPSRAQFAKLNNDDITYFKSILGDGGVLTDASDIAGYNKDWLGKYSGETPLVLRPKTTEEVSKIVKHCNARKLAIVPQGGNTGLVGGSVPVYDEIVLSMQRMNKIKSFNPVSGVVEVEAGAILQQTDEYLANLGYLFPLDLGAKGSCQVGGNASTNAGGIRLLRYGSLHGSILGLEVVLADGTILDSMQKLRKDNTGFDLKQLFIGSEGTLGIITGMTVLCPPRPKSVNVAFLALESFTKVQELFVEAKQDLGEILSAFEFLDNTSLETVLEIHKETKSPFETPSSFYVLIETHGSNEKHDEEKITAFLEKVISKEIVADGTMAQGPAQVTSIWKLREGVPECAGKVGKVYKYDVSLPVEKMYDLVEVVKEKLKNRNTRVMGYGHLGDSNLHLNVCEKEYTTETLNVIEPFVYEYTASNNGSISAEHGIGVMKPNHLHYSKSQVAIDLMHQLKHIFDPTGILNPYKVLPEK